MNVLRAIVRLVFGRRRREHTVFHGLTADDLLARLARQQRRHRLLRGRP